MAAKDPATTPVISSVRVKQGGVHFTGARTVHLLTTDKDFVAIAGNTTVVCDSISTAPTGVHFTTLEGSSHCIPYAQVEIINFA